MENALVEVGAPLLRKFSGCGFFNGVVESVDGEVVTVYWEDDETTTLSLAEARKSAELHAKHAAPRPARRRAEPARAPPEASDGAAPAEDLDRGESALGPRVKARSRPRGAGTAHAPKPPREKGTISERGCWILKVGDAAVDKSTGSKGVVTASNSAAPYEFRTTLDEIISVRRSDLQPATLTAEELATCQKELSFVEKLQARVDGVCRAGREFGRREVRNRFTDRTGAEVRQITVDADFRFRCEVCQKTLSASTDPRQDMVQWVRRVNNCALFHCQNTKGHMAALCDLLSEASEGEEDEESGGEEEPSQPRERRPVPRFADVIYSSKGGRGRKECPGCGAKCGNGMKRCAGCG
eukprot:CAMPEP_0119282354 /NCGR_PEP_ID=MMETSP1329-20130426/26555_1 /TAXON_ID=114041 /ORGANISM="Genus nov. species nov., Strain RCC1024" /LENGTH=353 /DNA_ID=CAMNT_0007283009 /DNA_START=222 /DNA_END=1280 /DNA_ORIENTATION=+